jgi:hypothetical protein
MLATPGFEVQQAVHFRKGSLGLLELRFRDSDTANRAIMAG